MALGVGIAKASALSDLFVVHYVSDLIGYAIHGIGFIPFINQIEHHD
jgi:hypothetical protein